MDKVILDTSVIIGILTSANVQSLVRSLIELVESRKIKLFISDQTLEELQNTIRKPQLKSRISPKSAQFMAWYKYNTEKCQPKTNIKICRDPNDDKYLDLVETIKAKYLLTFDDDLLSMKEFHNCTICKPDLFWQHFNF